MRQIDQLLQTLDESELNSLSSLPLQGKQREVMYALIGSRNDGSVFQAADLGLSPAHLHQICSVLLQRSYEALAPSGLVDLYSFLISKNLTKLLYQELRNHEANILHASRRDREKFYTIAFEMSQWVSFDEYDHALIDHFGQELLNSRSDSSPTDSVFVEIRKLRTSIREVFSAQHAAIEEKKELRRKLEYFSAALAGIKNDSARYRLHFAFIDYYVFIERNPAAVQGHITSAKECIQHLPTWLATEEQHLLDAHSADIEYMFGNYQHSYELFEQLWKRTSQKRLALRDHYHTLRFAEAAAIVGKIERSKEILDIPMMSGKDNLILCSKQIRLAVLSLLDDRVTEALGFIHYGAKCNKGKSNTLFTNIRLRFLEAVCAYLLGDWDHANILNVRALQFLQRKKLGLADSDFGYYFKFIEAVMIQHEIGKPIPDKLKAHYKKYSEGHFKFFGLILEKMLKSKGPNGWLPKGTNDWYPINTPTRFTRGGVKV